MKVYPDWLFGPGKLLYSVHSIYLVYLLLCNVESNLLYSKLRQKCLKWGLASRIDNWNGTWILWNRKFDKCRARVRTPHRRDRNKDQTRRDRGPGTVRQSKDSVFRCHSRTWYFHPQTGSGFLDSQNK